MKKSMLNVIILALVLVNLVLTVILTFSLVSTNKKTNSLINKVAQIIDLDVAGGVSNNNSSTGSGIENVSYIDIKNNDSTDIIVSYVHPRRFLQFFRNCCKIIRYQPHIHRKKRTHIHHAEPKRIIQ